MEKIILIGGGGHCKMVISQLTKIERFEIVGIVDNHKPVGSKVFGVEIIGKDEDLEKFYSSGIKYAFISVGSVKDNSKRQELFSLAKEIGYRFPVILSPQSIVDKSVHIEEGTIIMPGCIVNVESYIGKNCIINSGAIIEHGCKIGDHCHIASGANVAGEVEIGDLAFIGAGSVVIQGIRIGKNATVGAGSVVINDIPENVIAVGNPARIVKSKYD
ncbi:MAG: acetyltransferase [Sulfurihydrogenibium sp.]